MVQVLLSKYCAGADSRNSLSVGDKATWTGKSGNVVEVTIDSELMQHESAPGDGLGYECIFSDDGSRCFASADQIEIIRPHDYNTPAAIALRTNNV